jgi:Secretion system C-terminal sorting domain
MRIFLMFLSMMLANRLCTQVVNPGFDDWEVIQTGEPYENPIGWMTNNETDDNGFASTPVTKGIDSIGYYARVASSAHGIDAVLSGWLSQTISVENLVKIDFDSQCDSLFQSGRCIVWVLDQSKSHVLYVDSISIESDTFSRYTIMVENAWTQDNDFITLQFIAKGNLDDWDEQEDGYSIFLVDNIHAEYITVIKDAALNTDLVIYPNPSVGLIHFTHDQAQDPLHIEIVSLTGQILYKAAYADVFDLSFLPDGMYVVNAMWETGMEMKMLVFNRR